jgi:hypothetical protein
LWLALVGQVDADGGRGGFQDARRAIEDGIMSRPLFAQTVVQTRDDVVTLGIDGLAASCSSPTRCDHALR